MRTVIIYGSHHHGNTEKIVKAVAEKYPVDLLDAESERKVSLESYDLIGFASGIDFGKFYPAVTEIASTLPAGKAVYAVFTCAKDNGRYGDEIRELAVQRGCTFLGKFGCRGYNTYGPWKLIGGMNKNHPTEDEMAEAVRFYERMLAKLQRSR